MRILKSPKITLNGADISRKVYIDGNNKDHCLIIDNNAKVTIKRIGISAGNADYGAGIYCKKGQITLENSDIISCNAEYGGAIFINSSCKATIKNSEIVANIAIDGGGFYNNGTLEIGSKIFDNIASGDYGTAISNYCVLTITKSNIQQIW